MMNELTTEVTAISNLKQMKVIIKAELESLVDGCMAVGYYLKRTRDTEMFTEEGYESVFDFAKKEFNLGRSSVYTYMAINDNFSVGGNSPELADNFRGYGSSKLAEMLTLTDEQMQDITPDATVKEIKEYKKVINEIESPDVWTNGLNAQCEADFKLSENNMESDIIVKNGLKDFIHFYFLNEGRNVFEKVNNILLSAAVDKENKIMFAIAPSKFKMIRIPGGSALCNAENISIIRAGTPKEVYTYQELIEIITYLFEPSNLELAKETFKRYYQEDLMPPVPVKVEIKNIKEEKTVDKKIKPKQVDSSKGEDNSEEDTEDENEEDDTDDEDEIKELEDDNIPGQKKIEDYPECLPDAHEVVEKVEGEVIQEEPIKEIETEETNDLPEENKKPWTSPEIVEKAAEVIIDQDKCQYCNMQFPKNLVTENFFIAIKNNGYLEFYPKSNAMEKTNEKVKINLCPMCGRKFSTSELN